ncbi:MAG: 50S ribosomal protein L21 [candidate division CPR1 bacterium GW2011_GWC1_49_13]|uniref:50S ribosomal protein L21 n=1 Tax=candidate division CPR1 bacterium GW2011_GWC1_49_13 TaxID=1618342 RepID=A0A0G1XSX5_9BACT|nr:MAG: 50S ribosomal protein L21 [candidate division CPR1 bacterium GW2011_GWC1_49_13]
MEKRKITKTAKPKTAKAVKAETKPVAKSTGLAILTISGTQYLVKEGDELLVAKLAGKEGSTEKVPAMVLEPQIGKGTISYKIIGPQKGPKIRVATYKAKSRYRRVRGARAHLTKIEVVKITEGGK